MTNNISNEFIDKLYNKAISSGALGCKLLGAGQSGFMLVISKDQNKIKRSLACESFELKIDLVGTKIIYSD